MNDTHLPAGAPSLYELQRALDRYADDEDIFNFILLPPVAPLMPPGSRLERAWTAYARAANRLRREVLRGRTRDEDLQDWEESLQDAEIPLAVEAEYQTALLDACRTRFEKHIAFAEYMVNTRIVHVWRMYARCCLLPLLDQGVATLRTHVDAYSHELTEHTILDFQQWWALRRIARFVKAHPIVPRPILGPCAVCGAAATRVFTYSWGSDILCVPCLNATEEVN